MISHRAAHAPATAKDPATSALAAAGRRYPGRHTASASIVAQWVASTATPSHAGAGPALSVSGEQDLNELSGAEDLGHATGALTGAFTADAAKDGVRREQQGGTPGGADRGQDGHGRLASWSWVAAHSSIRACTNAWGRLPRSWRWVMSNSSE